MQENDEQKQRQPEHWILKSFVMMSWIVEVVDHCVVTREDGYTVQELAVNQVLGLNRWKRVIWLQKPYHVRRHVRRRHVRRRHVKRSHVRRSHVRRRHVKRSQVRRRHVKRSHLRSHVKRRHVNDRNLNLFQQLLLVNITVNIAVNITVNIAVNIAGDNHVSQVWRCAS
ncbi:hypothetical protein ACOMHN_004538 [Nucella lapillus]